MKRRSIVEGVALVGVALILATGTGAAWAGAPHATRWSCHDFGGLSTQQTDQVTAVIKAPDVLLGK